METLELKCAEFDTDFLTLENNHTGDKREQVCITIEDRRRVMNGETWHAEMTSLALDEEGAKEVVNYLNKFFNLEKEYETSRGVTTP